MNRRAFLRLGVAATVAPKALASPAPRVDPYAGLKAWLPVMEPTSVFGGAGELAALFNRMHDRNSPHIIAFERYQNALADQILVVARKMDSEGRLYRSAPL